MPEPERIPAGSGKVAPWMKQRPTPFEVAAIEIKHSDERSLGPKPITKKVVVVVN